MSDISLNEVNAFIANIQTRNREKLSVIDEHLVEAYVELVQRKPNLEKILNCLDSARFWTCKPKPRNWKVVNEESGEIMSEDETEEDAIETLVDLKHDAEKHMEDLYLKVKYITD